MRKPELENTCKWIVNAWEELNSIIIVKVFKKCYILNELDGTEDDIRYKTFIQKLPSTDVPQETSDDDNNTHYTDLHPDLTKKEFDSFYESDNEGELE